MFKCLKCAGVTALPRCEHCGHVFDIVNGIYQLTEDPNANLDDDKGTKYLGYDRIGAYYGGRSWMECNPASMVIAKTVAELIDRGVLLDLGCGHGFFAVPAVLHGCTVIAGDISNVMLGLLLDKAAANQANPSKIIPCRLNALSIPLADNCVDGAMANSVLHLISEPMVVISELHRVLKPGGKLMLVVNSPGLPAEVQAELEELNRGYIALVNAFHNRYWELLRQAGVGATRYSWKFDQYAACAGVFGSHTRIDIEFAERSVTSMSDGFLYRMGGQGFSDQQGVPDDLHDEAFAQVVKEFTEVYGPDFDGVTCVSVTDGLVLHVFEKREDGDGRGKAGGAGSKRASGLCTRDRCQA